LRCFNLDEDALATKRKLEVISGFIVTIVVRKTVSTVLSNPVPCRDVVNAAHLGAGVTASRAATALKPVLRRFAYAVGGLAAGIGTRGLPVRVEVDGRVLADGRRRVLMVGVGNGTTIGGGTPLAPDARPDDGLADVVVSFSTGPVRRLAYGVLLRLGRHGRQDTVVTTRGGRVEITGPPMEVNADGELTGPVTTRTWTVTPAAWRVIVPSPAAPPP
jgi:diacylglycerol kinase family enzyme